MTPLRITLLQTDIVWEDKAANLENLFHRLQALEGQTDLLVLPEMFSTGFSMNVAEQAETSDGPTIGRLRQWATQFLKCRYCFWLLCRLKRNSPHRRQRF